MKSIVGLVVICFAMNQAAVGQVDTSFVYRTGTPYGTLDIRIAKSSTRYYYLQENKTFSFREISPGVRTETFRDMTSWDSSPFTQGNMREKNGTQDLFVMNYRLLFPSSYVSSYPEGYPLILEVHGAGERGNCWDGEGCYWSDRNWKPLTNSPVAPTTSNHELLNNDHNLLHGGQIHLQARDLAGSMLPNDPSMPPRAFPGFVLFPQNLNGWDANNIQDMIKLVRLVAKKYNIDENRIYIHGLSNGGYGVYEAIKKAPWLFAAALPMSAVSDAQLTNATHNTVLDEVSNIPLWIFQGALDTSPSPSKTKTYIKKFRDEGMTVRYTEYSNLGHGTWNAAYNESDFFTWMLDQNKSNIHAFGNIAAICNTTGQGVRLELAKGFLAYQWERNGVIISNATEANYVADTPGIYRARFSRLSTNPTESQWNQWSDPITATASNPAQAQIIQKGTVILKDLNNYNNAHLSAVGDFAHYYWYKDGALLDLPGSQDDTTKNPIFKQGTCTGLQSCPGNGVYTLVTAGFDNCTSPPSEPKYVFFNNQAPTNINAPSAFIGSASSVSEVALNWNDASSNELGFEVWRRKIIGTGTFTTWSLVKLTSSNETSIIDNGVEPSSTYQYKVRAVGTGGKSNYTPSASNQFLTIQTPTDAIIPTTPQNLTATASGIREITLNWESSSDNSGIRNYLIIFDDDTVSTTSATPSHQLSNLNLNQEFSFTVKAVDLGGSLSEASNSAVANTFMTGLYYEHSTGGWTSLDQINWNIAEYNGKVSNFTLVPRTQEDFFNFEYEGYLYINTPGTYQFITISDDGSRLTLNDTVIVENDGLHGDNTVTSNDKTLSGGPQFINVKYFEYGGGQTLIVRYRGPDTGNNWIAIPDNMIKSGDPFAERMKTDRNQILTKKKAVVKTFAYPNPLRSHDKLTLVAEGLNDRLIHITLLNLVGESFFETSIEPALLNSGMNIIPKKNLAPGVYILIIRHGDEVIKQRVIVKD